MHFEVFLIAIFRAHSVKDTTLTNIQSREKTQKKKKFTVRKKKLTLRKSFQWLSGFICHTENNGPISFEMLSISMLKIQYCIQSISNLHTWVYFGWPKFLNRWWVSVWVFCCFFFYFPIRLISLSHRKTCLLFKSTLKMSCTPKKKKSSQRRHFDLKLLDRIEYQGDLVSAFCKSRSMSLFLFWWMCLLNNGPLFVKELEIVRPNDCIGHSQTYNYSRSPIIEPYFTIC